MEDYPQQQDDYTERLPSPPQIFIPPVSHSNGNGSEPRFMDQWGRDPTEWKYQDRRCVQEILPCLYLGPTSAGRNEDFLAQTGITMIIVTRHCQVGHTRGKPLIAVAAEKREITFQLYEFPNNQDFAARLSQTTRVIRNHIEEQDRLPSPNAGKVLITCETGNERSAALVVAYLMEYMQMELVDAILFVTQRRFCLHIDDPLKHTLLGYSDLLRARRDVEMAAPKAGPVLRRSIICDMPVEKAEPYQRLAKRSLEETQQNDANDTDMSVDSEPQFPDARHFAPFADRRLD
ncbi:MAG: hypothetical protein M1828_006956 [Chrysothrix sp. TS-e1954]|nr:MAG: hypothetical protein M1828_006956 [Chrysothrix sp. TS-e1954]